ncbi:MAG: hypothetical protein AAF610_09250 [Pseudomonadota bacterium]
MDFYRFMATVRRSRYTAAFSCFAVCACVLHGAAAFSVEKNLSEVENVPPTARASFFGQPGQGAPIRLDASRSTDIDSERLTYAWTLTAPDGSDAELDDASSPQPTFTMDRLGEYIARVAVGDGENEVWSRSITVGTTGLRAHAHRDDVEVFAALGEPLELVGRDVFYTEAEVVQYRWSLTKRPGASLAALSQHVGPSVTVEGDALGRYVYEVAMENARGEVAEARIIVTRVRRPVSLQLPERSVANVGQTITVMPAWSNARDSDKRLDWRLRYAPDASEATLVESKNGFATLTPDVVGDYVVQVAAVAGEQRSAWMTQVIHVGRDRAGSAAPLFGVPELSVRGGASDIDNDGVPDALDNCVETPNPDQIDTNGDGFGNRCDPDLDNDGLITNFGDLGILRAAFFSNPSSPNWNPDADFNSDGVVNFTDLGVLRFFFFNAPGPIANVFTNPAGGSWHDPANWSLGFIPNAAHAVRIDLAPGTDVIFSTGTTQISSIRTTSPLTLRGGTLNVTRLAEFNDTVTIEDDMTLRNAPMRTPGGNPNAQIVVAPSAQATFDNVVVANDITIGNAARVNVFNGLTLDDATVVLTPGSSTSLLQFEDSGQSTSTLGGTGEIVFNGTSISDARGVVQASGINHGLVIDAGITLRSGTSGGVVQHAQNSLPTIIHGAVIADLDGRQIDLRDVELSSSSTVTVSNGSEVFMSRDAVLNGGITVSDATLDIGNTIDDIWSNGGSILLVDGVLELGGSFDMAAIGTITGVGTAVIDGVLDNTGLSTDLRSLFPDELLLSTGGSVIGGTLVGTPLAIAPSARFGFDGVTLGTNVLVDNGSTLQIDNDLVLDNAAVTLGSDGSTSVLSFRGAPNASSSLTGTGEVVFSGTSTISSRNQIQVASSQHGLTIDRDVTLRTGTSGALVFHITNNGPLAIHGDVVADVAGREINLRSVRLSPMSTVSISNGSAVILSGNSELEGAITVDNAALDVGNAATDTWVNSGTITLVNGVLELGGAFGTSDIGTISGTGTTIIDGALNTLGQTLDISTLLPGMLELATGAEIVGGELTGGVVTIPSSQTVTFNGLLLTADVNVQNAATLEIQNGLTLSGATITLTSTGSNSSLSFEGAAQAVSTLGGTGEVIFAGNTPAQGRGRIVAGSSQHGLNIGPGVTVRTATTSGIVQSIFNNGPITIDGAVVADAADRLIELRDTTLSPQSTVDIRNGSEVFVSRDAVLNGAISVDNATLDLGNNAIDSWSNGGTITLINATVELGGVFDASDIGTLTGTGTSIVNGRLDNTGQVLDLRASLPGTLFLSTGGQILGGTLNGAALTVPQSQTFGFDGVTLSTDMTIENAGELEVDNGLTLDGATITLASSGSTTTIAFDGAAGTVSNFTGIGELIFDGTTTVSSRNRLQVTSSAHGLDVSPDITLTMGQTGGIISHLFNNGTVTVNGDIDANTADRQIELNGVRLAPTSVVTIGNGSEVLVSREASLEGTINVNGGTLDLGNSVNTVWNNAGNIALTNAVIEFGGTFATSSIGTVTGSGTSVFDGVLDNSGQTVSLSVLFPGSLEIANNAEVVGGTLIGAPLTVGASRRLTLNGVTLGTDMVIENAGRLDVENGLTLQNSTIRLASSNSNTTLEFDGASQAVSELDGIGEVVFGGTATVDDRNRIQVGSSGHGLRILAGVTVRTASTGGLITHQFNNGPITFEGGVRSILPTRRIEIRSPDILLNDDVEIAAGASLLTTGHEFGSNADIRLEIGGLASTDVGEINSTGPVELDGTLTTVLTNGFSPMPGDSVEVLTFTSATGVFANTITAPFTVQLNATDLSLVAN